LLYTGLSRKLKRRAKGKKKKKKEKMKKLEARQESGSDVLSSISRRLKI
jgi:hypothetical protein